MDDRIELDKLQLELEPDHDFDAVSIYTTMGVYKPGMPLGHKCPIANLPCSDTEDKDEAAYQIGNLFKNAPKLLECCKALMKQSVQIAEDFDIDAAAKIWALIEDASDVIANTEKPYMENENGKVETVHLTCSECAFYQPGIKGERDTACCHEPGKPVWRAGSAPACHTIKLSRPV